MGKYTKRIAALMVVVFAMFIGGNTLFIHTHDYDGRKITHSHPYLPGESHQHSAKILQCIANANTAAYTMLSGKALAFIPASRPYLGKVSAATRVFPIVFNDDLCRRRGPPACRLAA